MPLWNMTDANTGAPKFAVFGGNGVAANGNVLFANTQTDAFVANAAIGCNGITAVEKTSVSGPGHAGWVDEKRGTGGLATIVITNGGAGYTGGNGFLTITGGGTGNNLANVSYTVNAANSIIAVTINSIGSKYKTTPTVNTVATYSTQATFTVTMGGRANRVQYVTLVAAGSLA
jgi:hypothetical protein